MINLKEEINLSKKFNELEYDSKMLYCYFINSIKDYDKKYNKEKLYFKRKRKRIKNGMPYLVL
jgi:hypothetical protein